MSLLKVTSPHASGQSRVSAVMRDVLLATLPGVLVLTGYFGPAHDQHHPGRISAVASSPWWRCEAGTPVLQSVT